MKVWTGTEGHERGAHYWRFERPIADEMGDWWRDKAMTKTTWDTHLPEWVKKRAAKRDRNQKTEPRSGGAPMTRDQVQISGGRRRERPLPICRVFVASRGSNQRSIWPSERGRRKCTIESSKHIRLDVLVSRGHLCSLPFSKKIERTWIYDSKRMDSIGYKRERTLKS